MSAPASRAWPPVSVIVPVKDGAAALDRCLTALDAQDYPGRAQVVVVDNASTEDVGAAVAAHPGVALLREERRGSYAARNTGLAAATGESEVHLFARWLPGSALAADLRRRGIGLVAHPLEAIDQAALVTGQRFARWKSALRAA